MCYGFRVPDERCSLRVTRRYAAPAEEVWRALTDGRSLARWLGSAWPSEPREVEEGRVLEVDWPGASLVRVELREDGAGTVLTLDHDRIEAAAGMRAIGLWSGALDRLGEVA